MARKPAPRPVTADDVDPRHRWDRPLQAPGHTQVDFEERVTPGGAQIITLFPADELPIANRY